MKFPDPSLEAADPALFEGVPEMKQLAGWMDRVMSNPTDDTYERVFAEVREVTARFPAPGLRR